MGADFLLISGLLKLRNEKGQQAPKNNEAVRIRFNREGRSSCESSYCSRSLSDPSGEHQFTAMSSRHKGECPKVTSGSKRLRWMPLLVPRNLGWPSMKPLHLTLAVCLIRHHRSNIAVSWHKSLLSMSLSKSILLNLQSSQSLWPDRTQHICPLGCCTCTYTCKGRMFQAAAPGV